MIPNVIVRCFSISAISLYLLQKNKRRTGWLPLPSSNFLEMFKNTYRLFPLTFLRLKQFIKKNSSSASCLQCFFLSKCLVRVRKCQLCRGFNFYFLELPPFLGEHEILKVIPLIVAFFGPYKFPEIDMNINRIRISYQFISLT